MLKRRVGAENNTTVLLRFELKCIVSNFFRKATVSDMSANGLYNNFHEVVDISQSAPKVMSTRCCFVPSLAQNFFGLDQFQSAKLLARCLIFHIK